MLDARPDPHDASVAHQSLGIVARDRGEHVAALRELRQALRLARASSPERTGDVLATLGATLVYAGRTGEGLRRLAEAEPLTPRGRRPRLLLRRAHSLFHVGQYAEARTDLTAAIRGSRRAGDRLWEARALNNRSLVHLALGDERRAERDAQDAEDLLRAIGQSLEATHAVHNRAHAVLQRGDVPAALALFDVVTASYRDLGEEPAELTVDHAQALLAAGLGREAAAMAHRALASRHLVPLVRAEMLLVTARAELATDDMASAQAQARAAAALFDRQQRPRWAARARLLALEIRHRELAAVAHEALAPLGGLGQGTSPGRAEGRGAAERPGGKAAETPGPPAAEPPRGKAATHPHGRAVARRRLVLLRDAAALAEALAADHAPEAPAALLLHAQVALAAGRGDTARASLVAASAGRHTGAPLSRAAAWLAAALLAEQTGDRRGLLAACRRGLDAVDEHRATLGDHELRALASDHGLELAQLAVRTALRGSGPRALLWWAERWRATALTATAARPDDPTLAGDVAALRDVTRRLSSTDEDQPAPGLARERARLEAAVRRRYRHLRGGGRSATALDLDTVLSSLGDTVLLHLVVVDGALHALTATRHGVRRQSVGPVERAVDEAAYGVFSLRRAAHGRVVDLDGVGARLQEALLGGVGLPAGARVVVIPPAALLSAPWGLLPALADTTLSVAPSVTTWHRAWRAPEAVGRVALVTGPDLTTDQAEVTQVGRFHDGATVLGAGAATVDATLRALDGARLAHVTCHGTLRADAPLFSSLTLADGPLMVHDLERLSRAPTQLVLSACDSAGMSPVTADEALGLVSSLLAMGTRSVVASVAPVNDRATVVVMDEVHTRVAAGASLAEGLRAARTAAHTDPVVRATARAFTAWGA